MAKLKDLAEHLGLSQATVSRALNGYSTVNHRTKERVLEAAARLNYRPNVSARQLATGRAGSFGLVMPRSKDFLADPHFVEFLSGLTQSLSEHELDVVLTSSDNIQTYERFADGGKVDGFVISLPMADDPRIEALMERGFPFIVHGRTADASGYGYYDINNRQAFEDATRLLIDLGHRRIAFLNGREGAVFAQDRFRGYQNAMSGAGIGIDPALVFHGAMSEENGLRQTEAMFDLAQPPTAIICSSTILAIGATRRLREEGVVLGRDVSLISHDDGLSSLKTENFSVPLTVTRAPIREAGVAIGEMLIAQSKGAALAELQVVAPVELIVRGSTVAAPAR